MREGKASIQYKKLYAFEKGSEWQSADHSGAGGGCAADLSSIPFRDEPPYDQA